MQRQCSGIETIKCHILTKRGKLRSQGVPQSDIITLLWHQEEHKTKDAVPSGPRYEETCPTPYANNKGADQPAHPRSLIGTFFVRHLDGRIYTRGKSIMPRL